MTFFDLKQSPFDEFMRRDVSPSSAMHDRRRTPSANDSHPPVGTSRTTPCVPLRPWGAVPSPRHITPRDRLKIEIAQANAIKAIHATSTRRKSTPSQELDAVKRNQTLPGLAMRAHDLSTLKEKTHHTEDPSKSTQSPKQAAARKSTPSQELNAVKRNQTLNNPATPPSASPLRTKRSALSVPPSERARSAVTPHDTPAAQTPLTDETGAKRDVKPAVLQRPSHATTHKQNDLDDQTTTTNDNAHAMPANSARKKAHKTRSTTIRKSSFASPGTEPSERPSRTTSNPSLDRSPTLPAQTPRTDDLSLDAQTSDTPHRKEDPKYPASNKTRPPASEKKHDEKRPTKELQSNDSSKSRAARSKGNRRRRAAKTTNVKPKRQSHKRVSKAPSKGRFLPATNSKLPMGGASNSASQLVLAFPDLLNCRLDESRQIHSQYCGCIPQTNDDDAKKFKCEMTKDLRQSKERFVNSADPAPSARSIAQTPSSAICNRPLADGIQAHKKLIEEDDGNAKGLAMNMRVDLSELDERRDAYLALSKDKREEAQSILEAMQNDMSLSLALETHNWSALPVGLSANAPQPTLHAGPTCYALHANYEPLLDLDQEALNLFDKTPEGTELNSLLTNMISKLEQEKLKNNRDYADHCENYTLENKSLIAKATQNEAMTVCKYNGELKNQQEKTNKIFNEKLNAADDIYRLKVDELHVQSTAQFKSIQNDIDAERRKTQVAIDIEIEKAENVENASIDKAKDDELFVDEKEENDADSGMKDAIFKSVRSIWDTVSKFVKKCLDDLQKFIRQKLDALAEFSRENDSRLVLYFGAFLNALSDVFFYTHHLGLEIQSAIMETVLSVLESDIDETLETALHIAQTSIKALTVVHSTSTALLVALFSEYNSKAEMAFDIAWPILDLALTFAGVRHEEKRRFKDAAPEILKNPRELFENLNVALHNASDKWASKEGAIHLAAHVMDELVHLWLPKAKISFPTTLTLPSILKFVLEICGVNVDFILKQFDIQDIDEIGDAIPEGSVLSFLKKSSPHDQNEQFSKNPPPAQNLIEQIPSFASKVIVGLAEDFFKDMIEDFIEKSINKFFLSLLAKLTPVSGLIELAHMIFGLFASIRKYAEHTNSIFIACSDILLQCAKGATDGIESTFETLLISSGALLIQGTLKLFNCDPSKLLQSKIKEFRANIKSFFTKERRFSTKKEKPSPPTPHKKSDDSKDYRTIHVAPEDVTLPDFQYTQSTTNDENTPSNSFVYSHVDDNDKTLRPIVTDSSDSTTYRAPSYDAFVASHSPDMTSHADFVKSMQIQRLPDADSHRVVTLDSKFAANDASSFATQAIPSTKAKHEGIILAPDSIDKTKLSYEHIGSSKTAPVAYKQPAPVPESPIEFYEKRDLERKQRRQAANLGLIPPDKNAIDTKFSEMGTVIRNNVESIRQNHEIHKNHTGRFAKKIEKNRDDGNEQLQFFASLDYTPIGQDITCQDTKEGIWKRRKASKNKRKKT